MAFQSRAPGSSSMPNLQGPAAAPDDGDLHELLTVEDVAALLKVSCSWVYEHTRSRGTARTERLPCIKIGKYKRFDPQSVREFLQRRRRSREPVCRPDYNGWRATAARRASEEKGLFSYGSQETTVRQRFSVQGREGVGDPLAGAGDWSRRHDQEAVVLRRRSATSLAAEAAEILRRKWPSSAAATARRDRA